MRSRSLGVVLIVVGTLGLLGTSWVASTAPGALGPGPSGVGPGWMTSMHEWMMGEGPWSQAAPTPVPGAREVRVAARDFAFSPAELTVPAGTAVNVVLVNEGDLFHDLTIPSLRFRLASAPGATVSGALSAPRAGRYEFFCSVPGHHESGMEGALVVT